MLFLSVIIVIFSESLFVTARPQKMEKAALEKLYREYKRTYKEYKRNSEDVTGKEKKMDKRRKPNVFTDYNDFRVYLFWVILTTAGMSIGMG